MKRRMDYVIIAIDGFSSSGKSTLAKQLAKKLGYVYIDSGAMYRAVTLFAINNNIIRENFFDKDKLINKLPEINIHFDLNKNNDPTTILNDKNVEEEIRNINVANFVSIISKNPEVREKMVALQREMGKNKGIVMDGRDIGTVVFPHAEVKVFLIADVEVRAMRRYKELKQKNKNVSLEEIKKNIEERDKIDQLREQSPLKKADDAFIIDNSDISEDEQINIALDYINSKKNVRRNR